MPTEKGIIQHRIETLVHEFRLDPLDLGLFNRSADQLSLEAYAVVAKGKSDKLAEDVARYAGTSFEQSRKEYHADFVRAMRLAYKILRVYVDPKPSEYAQIFEEVRSYVGKRDWAISRFGKPGSDLDPGRVSALCAEHEGQNPGTRQTA